MIHVFGTICLDRMRLVSSLPEPGGYVSVDSERVMVGGEAANTAFALSAWNLPYRLYGNALGSEVMAKVAAIGLPTRDISTAEGAAPVCDIYVTPDGQRTMFGVGFGDMARTIDVDSISFPEEGWFTIDMNFGEVGRAVTEKAAEQGRRLYVMDMQDPSGMGPQDIWQSSTDWAGTAGDIEKNLDWVERKAKSLGATAILTDSGRDFMVGFPDGRTKIYPTFPPPLAADGSQGRLDSTGAGDRFRAGMLLGLHLGWPLNRCLAFAAATAAMKLAHPGAIAPVPSVEQVVAYQNRHPAVLDLFSA